MSGFALIAKLGRHGTFFWEFTLTQTQAQTPPLLVFPSMPSMPSMPSYADDSPTDVVPPPSYQLSQEQFDRKTSHAIQLSSSIHQPIVDEDGWPVYDATAFEAVAKSYQQSPPGGSTSAILPAADVPRHQRQAYPPPPTDPMKVRSS